MRLRSTRKRHPPVVAYAIQDIPGGKWLLCFWSHHNRARLGSKPSPEAKIVRCRLVPVADYKRMLAALEASDAE